MITTIPYKSPFKMYQKIKLCLLTEMMIIINFMVSFIVLNILWLNYIFNLTQYLVQWIFVICICVCLINMSICVVFFLFPFFFHNIYIAIFYFFLNNILLKSNKKIFTERYNRMRQECEWLLNSSIIFFLCICLYNSDIFVVLIINKILVRRQLILNTKLCMLHVNI